MSYSFCVESKFAPPTFHGLPPALRGVSPPQVPFKCHGSSHKCDAPLLGCLLYSVMCNTHTSSRVCDAPHSCNPPPLRVTGVRVLLLLSRHSSGCDRRHGFGPWSGGCMVRFCPELRLRPCSMKHFCLQPCQMPAHCQVPQQWTLSMPLHQITLILPFHQGAVPVLWRPLSRDEADNFLATSPCLSRFSVCPVLPHRSNI